MKPGKASAFAPPTTATRLPLPFRDPTSSTHTTIRPSGSCLAHLRRTLLAVSSSSSSGGFVIFLPFPCSLRARSALAASGSTTVFQGVNKVDAGANSVYFALFFQKNVCKRERAIAYTGKCAQTTSSCSTDLLSFRPSCFWIEPPEKRFYLLVAT